jgi:hypothetical protein
VVIALKLCSECRHASVPPHVATRVFIDETPHNSAELANVLPDQRRSLGRYGTVSAVVVGRKALGT